MAKELIIPSLSSPFARYLYSDTASDSAYAPVLPDTHPPFLKDVFPITSINSQTGPIAPGQALTFETPKNGSRLGKVYLSYSVSALTQTGGSTISLPNYAGYECIDHIDVYYGSNKIQTVTGHQAWLRVYKSLPVEDIGAIASTSGGGLTLGGRQAVATAPQQFFVELPLFWCDNTHKYIPIENFTTGITINVYFLPPVQLLQATGTNPTFTYYNSMLYCTTIAQTVGEVSQIRNLVAATSDGYVVPCLDVETARMIVNQGTTDVQLDVTPKIKGHVTDFILEVRAQADLNTPGAIVLDNTLPYNPLTVGIMANNNYLMHDQIAPFLIYNHWREEYVGVNTRNLIAWSFALNPAENFHTYGSVYFGGMRSILLHLTFAPGQLSSAAGYYVDMTCWERNAVQLKGDTMAALLI